MTDALHAFVSRELAVATHPAIAEAARVIGQRHGGVAVLFYGSVLRTGDLDAMLDFYVLTETPEYRGARGAVSRLLWPDISFEDVEIDGWRLRAKVATMPLATFRRAATGSLVDTTVWTRFVQPSALAWSGGEARLAVVDGVAAAARTAARFAAVLGPEQGAARSFWQALFRQTYRAELRVEKPGREEQILAFDPARYDALLRLAWDADAISYDDEGMALRPRIAARDRRRILAGWRRRRRWGRPLNAARLVKAAFLLDGAARYAAWKIQRHTGVTVTLTPWRERHPLLAAPGLVWQVWRGR